LRYFEKSWFRLEFILIKINHNHLLACQSNYALPTNPPKFKVLRLTILSMKRGNTRGRKERERLRGGLDRKGDDAHASLER
jgi:hypothetical protein